MKKHILILLLVIGIVVLGYHPISNYKIGIDKAEKKIEQSIEKQSMIGFIKNIVKTDENNNYLENVTFKAYSYNRAWSSEDSVANPDSEWHEINSESQNSDNYTKVYQSLSDEQREVIENIKDTDDLNYFINNDQLICTYYEESEEEHMYSCIAILPTVFTIEETQAPEGYVKEKVLTPGLIGVVYNIQNYERRRSNSNIINFEEPNFDKKYSVELAGILMTTVVHTYSMDFGEVEVDDLVGLNIDDVWNIWKEHHRSIDSIPCSSTSENAFRDMFKVRKSASEKVSDMKLPVVGAASDAHCNTIAIINRKGTVNLNATYYVNNSESTTAAINSKIDYKIVVNNTGTADAVDSVVTAKLPEGFVYVEGSASDGGKLVNGSIQWSVGRIKTSQNKELTFQAYAPRGTNLNQEYVGETTIENFAMDSNVQSNKTIVKLSEEYVPIPNTAKNVSILIILLGSITTIVGMVIISSILKKKQAM